MSQINAYLNFNGNCREAMAFYKECFGGELNLQTVGESPIASQMPAAAKNNILHATLNNNSLVLMGSDMLGKNLIPGNTVTLMLDCDSVTQIKTFFTKLSAGGHVTDPLADMFWGATYGSLTDKFGLNWMLNFDKNQK